MTVAQAIALTQQQLQLPVNRLLSSTLNDRDDEDFAGEEFDSLVASVGARGVLQPILVRPAATTGKGEEHFEIICGHRRTEAARKAGLKEVPAVVQVMGDREAVEAMILENDQRAALHPLAQAKAFRRWVDLGATTEEIAGKVKKSRRDVEVIIQLGKLSEKAQGAFRAGKLDKSRAVLLARIEVEKIQLEVMKQIARDNKDAEFPCNVKVATELVRRDFMLELSKAPFQMGDSALVPAVGACVGCPHNTQTQPELFSDVGSKALCTNKPCYESKVEAVWKQQVDERKAQGLKTLSDKEAKAAFQEYGFDAVLRHDAGYVWADEACQDDPKRRDYRRLLGKGARAAIVLARAPNGERVELLERAGLREKLREAGNDFWKEEKKAKSSSSSSKKSSSSTASSSVSPAVKAKQEQDKQVREKTEKALVLAVMSALEREPPAEIWRIAAREGVARSDEIVGHRFGDAGYYDPTANKEAEKWIQKAGAAQLKSFVLACALEGPLFYGGNLRDQVLKLLKVDERKIKDEVKKAEATRMSIENFTSQLAAAGFLVGPLKKEAVDVKCPNCAALLHVPMLDQAHVDIGDFDDIIDHQVECAHDSEKSGKAKKARA